uniref:Uncharacterized protein n=1 Tax=Rhizophora mucronata TaxID=61149 RepID=A0A2P2KGW8_RHIMU
MKNMIAFNQPCVSEHLQSLGHRLGIKPLNVFILNVPKLTTRNSSIGYSKSPQLKHPPKSTCSNF